MMKRTIGLRCGVIALTLVLGLTLGWAGADRAAAAQKPKLAKLVDLDQIPVGLDSGPADWTHVIYVARADGRKMTLALNELHAMMAERGWLFLDMMPHVEDGDLKGVWVSYRATGWGPAPSADR